MKRRSFERFAQLGGAATLDTLLPVVYADVPVRLHELARYSLLAHVLKLEEERRARRGR